MFFLMFFLFYAFLIRKSNSMAFLLSIWIAFSAFCGLVIGKTVPFDKLLDVLNILYTILILTIIISFFRKYSKIENIIAIDDNKIKTATIILISMGVFSFLINSYLFYKIMSYGILDYEIFKNQGEGSEFAYSLGINHSFITLAYFISPVAYPLIGFGFYYAYLRKKYVSTACFVLSLNMPLHGFTNFSRSTTVLYFLLLIVYFFFSKYLYDRKKRRGIIILFATLLVPLVIYLYNVTENRFKSYNVENVNSVVQNPLIYSSLDYNSQWIENSINVMSNYYSIEKIQYGKSTNTLFPFIFNTLFKFLGWETPDNEKLSDARAKVWDAPYYYTFNGLVVELVFDFGYFLTFILSLIYAFIVRYFAPHNGKITIFGYIFFGIVITVPIISIYGNYFAVLYYNFAIIYCCIIGFYLKYRIKLNGTISHRSIFK